jgi:hypothetical protein
MLTEVPLCFAVKQSKCECITHHVERRCLAAQVQEGEDVLCRVSNMAPIREGMRAVMCTSIRGLVVRRALG